MSITINMNLGMAGGCKQIYKCAVKLLNFHLKVSATASISQRSGNWVVLPPLM
jgi:hypothetical protein